MAQITSTTPTLLGGFTIPWDVFRPLLPDDRWAIYAAGIVVAPGPSVTLTVSYQKDNGALVPIGTATIAPTASEHKAEIGPFPARGAFAVPLGVPAGENIISVVLGAALSAAGTAATMKRWTMWLRMTPRNV